MTWITTDNVQRAESRLVRVRLCVLQLYHGAIHLHKVSRNNMWYSFQVREWTQIYYRNYYFQNSKGHNSKS